MKFGEVTSEKCVCTSGGFDGSSTASCDTVLCSACMY